MISIKELNSSMIINVKSLSREEFRKFHQNAKPGTVDNFVANIIEKIEHKESGYKIYDVNGHTLEIRYNGSYSKDGKKFKYQLTESYSKKDGTLLSVRPRIVSRYFNSSRTFEYWIGLCSAYLANELPETFDCKLEVNVMDHSGNLVTAEKLGIPFDIHEYNLEWCLHDENKLMGQSFKKISKMVGGIYRFSAMDSKIKELYQLKKYKELKDYLDKNYTKLTDYCVE